MRLRWVKTASLRSRLATFYDMHDRFQLSINSPAAVTMLTMNQHSIDRHLIEALESKRFLSATLKSGIVTILGTEMAETINFWFSAKNNSRLIVRNGSEESSFSRGDVRLIRVQGKAGDDRIRPLNIGGEVNIPLSIDGGPGDDRIVGGSGDDTLIGGPGNDDLSGGKGADFADYRYVNSTVNALASGRAYGLIAVIDAESNDITADGTDNIQIDIEGILGTKFRDSISASGEANTIYGGNGPDQIYGSAGNDLIDGGEGANNMIGGSGADTLIGGSGDSTLEGDSGNDLLRGGSGNEFLAGGLGNDRYFGGPGFDSADFSARNAPAFSLSFDEIANDGPAGQKDNFFEINSITTSGKNDRIDATALPHGLAYRTTGTGASVQGTEFADTLSAGDGEIFGLGGNDIINGGITGNTNKNVIDGGAGNDTIQTGDANDVISGGRGNDRISSGDGSDTVNGGAGNDSVHAGIGDDSVLGASGTDHLFGEDGNDTLIGNGAKDFLTGAAGADRFFLDENLDGFVQDFEQGVDVLIASS